MSLETFYFEITQQMWVRSEEDSSRLNGPTFGYKDNRDFGVVFLRRLKTSGPSSIERITSVVAAQIGLAVGTTKVTGATASAATNNEFPFVLPVIDSSGTTLQDLMSGKTSPQTVNLEFKLTTSLGTNRYYTQAFVAPQVNVDTVPDPAVTEPAVTMSEVAGVMVPKQWPQNLRIYGIDEVTGERIEIALRNRQFEFNILG